jgi:hypothetical protein
MKVKIALILSFLLMPFGKIVYGELDVNNAQALFIYNFLTNVQWPEGTVGSNYVIGVLGKTGTTEYLMKYTNQRKIGQKSIEVVQYNSSTEINNCQLLLIAQNKSSEVSSIQQKTKGKGCLIVGEKAGLTNSGAVIDFNVIDGKLRYKISEQNAKEQKLFISSQLLQMSLK